MAAAHGHAGDNCSMRYFLPAAALAVFSILQGCSPTLNWRDVRIDQTPLLALLPCKPDRGAREVSLGAQEVTISMLGCGAGGATFTVAYADVKDVANVGAVLGQWKAATLASMRTRSSSELPYAIKGASTWPQPVQVRAEGVRPDGTAVVAQAVWFVVGSKVFQAVMYTDKVSPVVAETYFAGLRLQ
jgi:hypothetical protein